MVSISHSLHFSSLRLLYHLAHYILFSIWLLVHQMTLFALHFINLFLCNCSCYFLKAFKVAQMIEVCCVCVRAFEVKHHQYTDKEREGETEREKHTRTHTITCNCYGTKSIIQFTYNTMLMRHRQHHQHSYSYYSACERCTMYNLHASGMAERHDQASAHM